LYCIKSEILTKQQQNLVYYSSKGDKELEGRWVGFFVDNVPVAENWMLGMCRFSILIVLYNFILKYADFLFDSIEHQKLDIFKELCQRLI
jgi:hypothetical protein